MNASISKQQLKTMLKIRLEKKLSKKPFTVHERGFAFSYDNSNLMEEAYLIIADCCNSEGLHITECSADDGFGSDRWSKLIAIGDGIGFAIVVKYENPILEITII